MKKNLICKTVCLLSCIFLVACNPNSSTSENNSINSNEYDSSWQPSSNALEDASQPTIKNPVGQYNLFNKMRASNDQIGLPSKGEDNILVVPIEFKDDEQAMQYTDTNLRMLKQAYFSSSSSDKTYPSVSSYFLEASSNQLKLGGVITPKIVLPNNLNYYITKVANYGYLEPKYEILSYIYNYLFNETGTYYLKDFDANKDGKVDNIVLVYNYPSLKSDTGYKVDDEYLTSFLSSETYFKKDFASYENEKTLVNSFTFTSSKYLTSAFITSSKKYSFGSKDSHEYIKQAGRALGLDDYSDSEGLRAPLGNTDMMEIAINDLNPFAKYQLGYIEPSKVITSELTESKIITLNKENPVVLLSNKDVNLFGEYLLVTYYDSSSRANMLDASSPYYLGYQGISESGIRVYKVDSRLVRGYSEFELYEDEINFDDTLTLNDSTTAKYKYDYAFTNSSTNKYASSGISFNFPLVSLLTKNETNRHIVSSSITYNKADQFYANDIFGDKDSISQFYYNFMFDGDGYNRDSLGMSFKVNSVNQDGASLTIERI